MVHLVRVLMRPSLRPSGVRGDGSCARCGRRERIPAAAAAQDVFLSTQQLLAEGHKVCDAEHRGMISPDAANMVTEGSGRVGGRSCRHRRYRAGVRTRLLRAGLRPTDDRRTTPVALDISQPLLPRPSGTAGGSIYLAQTGAISAIPRGDMKHAMSTSSRSIRRPCGAGDRGPDGGRTVDTRTGGRRNERGWPRIRCRRISDGRRLRRPSGQRPEAGIGPIGANLFVPQPSAAHGGGHRPVCRCAGGRGAAIRRRARRAALQRRFVGRQARSPAGLAPRRRVVHFRRAQCRGDQAPAGRRHPTVATVTSAAEAAACGVTGCRRGSPSRGRPPAGTAARMTRRPAATRNRCADLLAEVLARITVPVAAAGGLMTAAGRRRCAACGCGGRAARHCVSARPTKPVAARCTARRCRDPAVHRNRSDAGILGPLRPRPAQSIHRRARGAGGIRVSGDPLSDQPAARGIGPGGRSARHERLGGNGVQEGHGRVRWPRSWGSCRAGRHDDADDGARISTRRFCGRGRGRSTKALSPQCVSVNASRSAIPRRSR